MAVSSQTPPWLKKKLKAFSALLILLSLIPSSNSSTCSTQKFTNNKLYKNCNDLPTLESYLHWSYDQSKSTLSVAFIAPPDKSDGWIAWAINPNSAGMLGAQSLIAFKDSSGAMSVKTYNITSYKSIQESKVWFDVKEATAEFSGGVIRLFATVVLPESGKTTVNHVWQVGSSVTNGVPNIHGFQNSNLNAKGILDLLNGQSNNAGSGSLDSRTKRKNIHGILNVVSWGMLLPVGAITGRFLKKYDFGDPAWFYLHIFFQLSGCIIAVAGFATGIKLGDESKGIQHSTHRNIGIALVVLVLVQALAAMLIRPKKDHKYRFYWNIYHHGLGYIIIVLACLNIFKGFDILMPPKKWKTAYIVVIIVLAAIAVVLQLITWFTASRRKSNKSTKPYDGENRQQPLAA